MGIKVSSKQASQTAWPTICVWYGVKLPQNFCGVIWKFISIKIYIPCCSGWEDSEEWMFWCERKKDILSRKTYVRYGIRTHAHKVNQSLNLAP